MFVFSLLECNDDRGNSSDLVLGIERIVFIARIQLS